jgi:hypothetical protein
VPTDPKLLAALREKLGGVSTQAISQRRQRLTKLVPMHADIATYVIAQREGLKLSKYLKDATLLAQVADADARLQARESAQPTTVRSAPRKVATGSRVSSSREVKLGDLPLPAAALSPGHVREAERMAHVYPMLYVFENSAREFIDGHLDNAYGAGWWDEDKLVPREVRRTVEISRKAERENRTHTSAKARPIYYTTFGDLVRIVESENGWKVFKPPLFPRRTWFPELVASSEVTRNIVAHMNPLQPADVRRLEMAVNDWLRQIKGHEPPPF